jgi:hypothetical protein
MPSDPLDKDRHFVDCVIYVLLDSPGSSTRMRSGRSLTLLTQASLTIQTPRRLTAPQYARQTGDDFDEESNSSLPPF